MPDEFKISTITRHVGFVSGKKLKQGNHTIIVRPSYQKVLLTFQNVSCPHENKKLLFSKSVFKKLRFLNGLVWMEGLNVEIRLPFKIPPAK